MEAPPTQPPYPCYLYRQEDGLPLGPLSLSQIQALVEAGHIGPSTAMCREGDSIWTSASQVPGLTFPQMAQPGSPHPSYPWQEQPKPGRLGAMDLVAPVRADPWAVLAGYLGLFSFILIAAPLSLAVSILALRSLKQHPDRTGKGRAWFGLIMGVLGTPLLLWVVASLIMRP